MSIVNWSEALNHRVDGARTGGTEGEEMQFFTHYTSDNIVRPAPRLSIVEGEELDGTPSEAKETRVDFKYMYYTQSSRKKKDYIFIECGRGHVLRVNFVYWVVVAQ